MFLALEAPKVYTGCDPNNNPINGVVLVVPGTAEPKNFCIFLVSSVKCYDGWMEYCKNALGGPQNMGWVEKIQSHGHES